MSETWAKSLLRRIGFRWRVAANINFQISNGAKKEIAFRLFYKIAELVEDYQTAQFPESMLLFGEE